MINFSAARLIDRIVVSGAAVTNIESAVDVSKYTDGWFLLHALVKSATGVGFLDWRLKYNDAFADLTGSEAIGLSGSGTTLTSAAYATVAYIQSAVAADNPVHCTARFSVAQGVRICDAFSSSQISTPAKRILSTTFRMDSAADNYPIQALGISSSGVGGIDVGSIISFYWSPV